MKVDGSLIICLRYSGQVRWTDKDRPFSRTTTHFWLDPKHESHIVTRFTKYYWIKNMFPPGLEPGTFRVLGERDNHYTTETLPKCPSDVLIIWASYTAPNITCTFHQERLLQNKIVLHSLARDVIGQIWILDDPTQPSCEIWSLLCHNHHQWGNCVLKWGQKGAKVNVGRIKGYKGYYCQIQRSNSSRGQTFDSRTRSINCRNTAMHLFTRFRVSDSVKFLKRNLF